MMGNRIHLQIIKIAVLLSLLAFSSVSIAASGTFKIGVPADNNTVVDVSNQSGAVVVRGADVDEVTVYARIKLSKRYAKTDPQKAARLIAEIKRSPPVETDGNRVIIGELRKRTHKRHASISYEILVPSEATVNVHSVSGDVRVSGVTGEVSATSEEGEVTIADTDDKRTAKTSR